MNFNGDGSSEYHKSFEQTVNPGHIVNVTDLSRETLQNVIVHLEASTEFEHLIYREAELDAIWSIAEFLLATPNRTEGDDLRRLHVEVHRAHDLVADNQPVAAAAVLRSLLN